MTIHLASSLGSFWKFYNCRGAFPSCKICCQTCKINSCGYSNRNLHYIQGQSPEPDIREYFYYIDHQGMLFLDDAKMKNFTSCFKEKKFLVFFFTRLQLNNTTRYRKDFPYLSLCGKERNFVRCDDFPVVYTHIIKKKDEDSESVEERLCYNHAGDLLNVKFEADKLLMLQESGRVYYPASRRAGGIGLVQSKLAVELSRHFVFENGEDQAPTHINWNEKRYELSTSWYQNSVKQL